MILIISVVSVIMSSFFIYNLLIWVFSLSFISLFKGSSNLFIFAKSQLLVLLVFSLVFLSSISFISAPVFIIAVLCPFGAQSSFFL